MRSAFVLLFVAVAALLAGVWLLSRQDPAQRNEPGASTAPPTPPQPEGPKEVRPVAAWSDPPAIPAGIFEDPLFRSGLGTLRGRVVDRNGRPVAGLPVVWRSATAADPPRPWEEVAATSGRDGGFVLTGVAPFEEGYLSDGVGSPYVLDSSSSATRTARPGDPVDAGFFVADYRVGVRGVVVGADGEPCVGARVSIATTHTTTLPDAGVVGSQVRRDATRVETETQAGGRFAVDGLEAGRLSVRVRLSGGFVPFETEVDVDVADAPGEVTDLGTFRAPAGRTMSCRVEDVSGAPVAGAEIALVRNSESERVLALGVADAEGRATFHGCLGSSISLAARRPGGPWTQVHGAPVPEPATIRLAEPIVMRIQVRDTGGGAVDDARIHVIPSRDTASRLELTGEEVDLADRVRPAGDGAFEVPNLVRGLYELRVRDATGGQVAVCTVGIERSTPVVVALEAGRILRGRVVDSRGRAVRYAQVQTARRPVVWTDRDGAFALDVTGAAEVELRVWHPAFRPRRVRPARAEGAVEVRLLRHCVLEGRVTVPQDNPDFHGWRVGIGAELIESCDAEGRFYTVFDSPGVLTIEFLADGADRYRTFGIRGRQDKRITIVEGRTSVTLDSDWSPAARLSRVRGVVQVDHQPVLGMHVATVLPGGRRGRATRTGRGGVFVLGGVDEGEVVVRATGQQFGVVWWEGLAKAGLDAPELRLDLETGRVSGMVLDQRGVPVPGIAVLASGKLAGEGAGPAPRASFRATTDRDGRFSFRRLPVGEYRLGAYEDIRSGAFFYGDWVKSSRAAVPRRPRAQFGQSDVLDVRSAVPLADVVIRMQREVFVGGNVDVSALGLQGAMDALLRFTGPVERDARIKRGRFSVSLLPGSYTVTVLIGRHNAVEVPCADPVEVADRGAHRQDVRFDAADLDALGETAKAWGFATVDALLAAYDLRRSAEAGRGK